MSVKRAGRVVTDKHMLICWELATSCFLHELLRKYNQNTEIFCKENMLWKSGKICLKKLQVIWIGLLGLCFWKLAGQAFKQEF